MRKIVKLLSVFTLLIALTACGGDNKNDNNTGESKNSGSNTIKGSTSTSSDKHELEIVDFGYSQSEDLSYFYYGIKLKNPNEDYGIEYPTYKLTLYAEDGTIISVEEQTLGYIAPNETLVNADYAFITEKEVDKVETTIIKTNDYNFITPKKEYESSVFNIGNISENKDDYSITFTGEVENTASIDFDSLRITVLYINDGKIVGGDYDFVGDVRSGAKTSFQIYSFYEGITFDSYEIYAQTW